MRECFFNLDEDVKKNLATTNFKDEQCVNNLYDDHATNTQTMELILKFFKTNDLAQLKTKGTKWVMQGGIVGIQNPNFVTSLQKVDTIYAVLKTASAGILKEVLVYTPVGDTVTKGELLELISEYTEQCSKNKARYPDKNYNNTNLKIRYDQIIWVTWNEEQPNNPQKFDSHEQDIPTFIDILGLGYNDVTHNYIILCFDLKNTKSLKIYRPGWGDATTYHFWRPITVATAPYGYTKPLTKIDDKQPEAIIAVNDLHINLISEHSFVI
jgi:hypothetical protein